VHVDGGEVLIKKAGLYLLVAIIMVLWARDAHGQEALPTSGSQPARQAIVLDVQGPIGPATRDFIIRSLETAAERGAGLVVIRLDTPGGLDASTRDIVKAILGSTVPVATYVAPDGARAASAGTFILYASHVAAMSPATNVGAATPVSIIGETPKPEPMSKGDEPEDEAEGSEEQAEKGGAMTQKVVNDAVAYIRGLAEKRGRNADWAELAVRDADSVTSEEALELGVIDLIAENVGDLLEKIDGMVVEVNDRDHVLETAGMETEQLEPDWRSEFLGVITSPTIAYMLLLIGVYGLILEGYHPGAIVPGVVGAICLLMALYAFQMLPVNYAGLALIVLGIILMIADQLRRAGYRRHHSHGDRVNHPDRYRCARLLGFPYFDRFDSRRRLAWHDDHRLVRRQGAPEAGRFWPGTTDWGIRHRAGRFRSRWRSLRPQ
jgi:membrane-bound serine protease (ClpP class)